MYISLKVTHIHVLNQNHQSKVKNEYFDQIKNTNQLTDKLYFYDFITTAGS